MGSEMCIRDRIYIGWKTFNSPVEAVLEADARELSLSNYSSFRIGFITNVLNPKTTIFFLSIFTQVVEVGTPLIIQIVYGAIISLAHLLWFSSVSLFLSQPALLRKFHIYKKSIEKTLGCILMGFGLKVAFSSNN